MAYGDIKISELSAVSASENSDVLPVVQAGSTKKASIAQIKVPILDSPALTGSPTAPTPAVGDNDTSIATTAFVNAEIDNDRPYATEAPLMDGTAAVGASAKVAREDHVHPSDSTKADLASPALTGTPTAPTASVGTSDTQIATTAFVNAEIVNDTDYLADFRTWDATRTYGLNEPTFENGVPYRSLIADNLNYQPSVSPEQWEVTGGGANAANPGVTFDNPDFESSTTGWSTYKDAAQATPEDGTGGTATLVSFSRDSTTPLIGNGSGLITKTTNSAQGEGVSYDFAIDRGIVHEEMKIEFQYEASSLYADGYVGIFLYDKTNAVLIPLSVQDVPASYGKPGTFLATFIPSTSTEYRLIFHVATDTTTEWTMMIDNVVIGNKDIAVGAAISEWQSYTPTITGAGTLTNIACFWRRVGSTLEVNGRATSGSSTGTTATISLPSGLSQINYNGNRPVGHWWRNYAAVSNMKGGSILCSGSDTIVYMTTDADASSLPPFSTMMFNQLIASMEVFSFMFSVQIAQWTSNVNLASDFTEYASNSDSSNALSNIVNFTYGSSGEIVPALNGAVGEFATRNVRFKKPIQPTDVIILELISPTGRALSVLDYGAGLAHTGTGYGGMRYEHTATSTDIQVIFGQVGAIWWSSSYTWTTLNSAGWKWRVRKVSNGNMAEVPPVVRAVYYNQIATNAVVPLNYSTKDEDTHNCVTTGTSWKFTAPIAGVYSVTCVVMSSTTVASRIMLYKNGAVYEDIGTIPNVVDVRGFGNTTIRLNAGDYFDVRSYNYGVKTNASDKIIITRIGS